MYIGKVKREGMLRIRKGKALIINNVNICIVRVSLKGPYYEKHIYVFIV